MTQMPPSPVSGRLAGKTALVTGAAFGIGYATAERLAAEGACLVLMDVAGEIHDAAGRLRAIGGTVFAVPGDVSDEEAWERAAELARAEFGGIDILVSNAFTNKQLPAHQLSRTTWDTLLAVNLTATFLGIRACIGDLVKRQGAVVITSSVHALIGLPGNPAYAAAKGGLTALTRQLAVEYGPAVRVNAVLPGPILTRIWDSTSRGDRLRAIDQTTAKRFGEPAEVAAAIAFLASPDASYITGSALAVDGGWSIFKTSV
jgi:NAD(P)-dependent dehydrogenase (short-subunit alcohol dehydrogenase family)